MWRFAARVSGLAFGLALAVRPAGLVEAPGSRVGSKDRFCEAVRNDLGVPLTLEGPARTMRGVPTPVLVTFAWRSAHLARDDRPGQLAERMTHGALRRGVWCGGMRSIGAAGSGKRRFAIALEEAAGEP